MYPNSLISSTKTKDKSVKRNLAAYALVLFVYFAFSFAKWYFLIVLIFNFADWFFNIQVSIVYVLCSSYGKIDPFRMYVCLSGHSRTRMWWVVGGGGIEDMNDIAI